MSYYTYLCVSVPYWFNCKLLRSTIFHSTLHSYSQTWSWHQKKDTQQMSAEIKGTRSGRELSLQNVFFQHQVLTTLGQLVGQTQQKSFCEGCEKIKGRNKATFIHTWAWKENDRYIIEMRWFLPESSCEKKWSDMVKQPTNKTVVFVQNTAWLWATNSNPSTTQHPNGF